MDGVEEEMSMKLHLCLRNLRNLWIVEVTFNLTVRRIRSREQPTPNP